ncbi:hypothetical protein [Kitasatospora phosalacinea]|uniref:Uncharacterized protein n=1 Tax=Kitasatospora phosalacinea TaxID=2065 RepID=A0A9W6UPJ5_9ACTN|nr:hypothetical protein [Kitasatospora phosalacinea]GLW55227.1 hypothetical protein Kpho01_32380 [Kitasatospora phosalacinea]
MTRVTLVTGTLVLGVCAVPSGVVLGLALAAPNDGRRWLAFFVALALAMVGGAFGPDWVEGWQRRRHATAQIRRALRDGGRVVRVEYVRAVGFLLEIEGTGDDHFVPEDDAARLTRRCAEDAARKSLGIPEDVPVTLVITSEDDWLLRQTRGVVVPVED